MQSYIQDLLNLKVDFNLRQDKKLSQYKSVLDGAVSDYIPKRAPWLLSELGESTKVSFSELSISIDRAIIPFKDFIESFKGTVYFIQTGALDDDDYRSIVTPPENYNAWIYLYTETTLMLVFFLKAKEEIYLTGENIKLFTTDIISTDVLFSKISEFVVKFRKIKLEIPQDAKYAINCLIIEKNNFHVRTLVRPNKALPEMTLNLDYLYGEGFSDKNTELLKTLSEETKGIIIFRGPPGTGKTQYIKYLLNQMKNSTKTCIYISKDAISDLENPAFINFLIKYCEEQTSYFQNKDEVFSGLLLIIEDAEALVVNKGEGRTSVTASLLNVSDGILNDIFQIQILLTLNCNINEIDPAVLRPGRLMDELEFRKLTFNEAKKLVEVYSLPEIIVEQDYSLAELFASSKTIKKNKKYDKIEPVSN